MNEWVHQKVGPVKSILICIHCCANEKRGTTFQCHKPHMLSKLSSVDESSLRRQISLPWVLSELLSLRKPCLICSVLFFLFGEQQLKWHFGKRWSLFLRYARMLLGMVQFANSTAYYRNNNYFEMLMQALKRPCQ